MRHLRHQKNIFIISLFVLFTFTITGCTTQKYTIKPIFFKKSNKIQADVKYYEGKAQSLVRQLYYDSRKMEISRIAVLNLVDMSGKIPVLGKFLTEKISSVISIGGFFTIIQRGELQATIDKLDIYEYDRLDNPTLIKLGKLLALDALIVGNITDLGTGIDVTITSINVKTGEVIASASEEIARTKYAVNMMQSYLF